MINLYSANQILTYIYVPSIEIYGSVLLLSPCVVFNYSQGQLYLYFSGWWS